MSAAQHIEWLNLVEKTGPFLAVGVLDEAFPQGLEKIETRRRQRVRSAYDEWRDAVDDGDPQLDKLNREWVRLVLEELLEYEPSVLKPTAELPATLNYLEPLTGAEVKPDFAVLSGDKARLLVARYAPDTDLSAPLAGQAWAASPIERMIALCRATGVRVGLITDGEQWTLVSVPADGASSLGIWYARIWLQEPVTLQAFVSLLGVRRCFGSTEGTPETLLARSLEHQNEVTDTLGEQVRRAVEVLVQAFDRVDLDRNRQLLKDVSPAQLYEAGLTVMMRLVVLLCAEERKLLLLDEPIYKDNYAVSTLRSKLREDKEHLGDEVLERRHDAWSRLLAVFRAVFGGIEHEALRLPPLGGSLFDPDRFPFLEGRATGTSWRDTAAAPLPIDNRTVLMLLTALQVLEQRTGALLLSYESLDVEQIGHVYEGLLERTVKRVPETTLGLIGSQKAINPNIALRELEETRVKGDDQLLAYLLEKTGRSESGLKRALAKPVDDPLYHRVLLACGSDVPLADRIKPWSMLVRTDSWGDPLVYRQDAFIVTLGAGRRETGTHYTPKSLTEPIVQHTLEPLIYIGPANGKPKAEWQLRTPAELLALKICDMAMGSAAFLVQVCRYLGERLVEAWDAQEQAGKVISVEGVVLDQGGSAELLPKDRAERILIARRLIASRCLYGVDINPMAVELAKVSLWLVTLMKSRPFTFLDHALKCGDSLLGVSSVQQIENFSLRPGERQVTFATANLSRYVDEASAKRRALEDLPSNDHTQIETKNRLNAEAEAATAKVKAVADCLIAFELRGLDGKAYEEQRVAEAEKVQLLMKHDADAGIEISNSKFELARAACEALHGRRLFHWPVEFPEVFARGGFDAFVGNPPFMVAFKVAPTLGAELVSFLKLQWSQKGRADLSAYFLLRAGSLNRTSGCLGLITTKTIAQEDNRRVALDHMEATGFVIYRAVPNMPWPGLAAVHVCVLHTRKGSWVGEYFIDDKLVEGISTGLEPKSTARVEPTELARFPAQPSKGTTVNGTGFILASEEALRLIKASTINREVIKRYLNGAELNDSTDGIGPRWIVDFGERNRIEAERYKEPWSIVESRVAATREAHRFQVHEKDFWKFSDKRPDLYNALREIERAIVFSLVSKYFAFSFAPAEQLFSSSLGIIPTADAAVFGTLQSTIHVSWAQAHQYSLKGDPRYSIGRCYRTFPFPDFSLGVVAHMRVKAEDFHARRKAAMAEFRIGLRVFYDRFHDRSEQSADIARLRALHAELDQAVAAAYGWSDLDLGHGFHATKQGERYTLSEPARRTVLDRLLALNHQRYAEEVAAGLHDSGKKAKKLRNKLQPPNSASAQGQLL